MQYDYLIAGAGLFGATFAQAVTERGRTCLVLDRRPHIAGNAYTKNIGGILVHQYGAHIFHTGNQAVWDYVNRFSTLNHFINAPLARYQNELYNLPFNMNTFSKLWNVFTPAEAKAILEKQRAEAGITEPKNLEEQALCLVGRDIYEKLIKGYTEKQWGTDCRNLPAFIIKRVPLRFTYDNNYFNDPWQGIPVGGYTKLVEKLLTGVEVRLNTDYFDFIRQNPDIARKTVYTGAIDAFFDYRYGALAYRSLRFETELLDSEDYQGNAVVNYTEREVPFTRIIEHKHFAFGAGNANETVVTREYPADWKRGDEPYYPVNNETNNALYAQYRALAETRPDVIFGGRLGTYKYYDMDQVIAEALSIAAAELEDEG
ncbi:MAG: UDP-galactopyranose mutase [Clostridiales bacterium]|nr:UDP-galactopyranose mutase [Clostridiales bacterium]